MSQPALRLVEGSSMDKSKALSAALSQIERQFGKGSVMRMGDHPVSNDLQCVPTGSLALDIALGVGGLPRGRGLFGTPTGRRSGFLDLDDVGAKVAEQFAGEKAGLAGEVEDAIAVEIAGIDLGHEARA